MASKDVPADADRLPVPSRNPLPLSATQEAQVRDIYYTRVRNHCAPEIKAFAECAAGRTLTVSFACREPLHAMNSCMKAHATQAEQDAAREEWFAMRLARQRERERKQLKKSAQEDFMREWWRMPERDEESRRKLAEKQALEERVGGGRASHPSDERK